MANNIIFGSYVKHNDFSGNATEVDVSESKTFYNTDSTKKSGTLMVYLREEVKESSSIEYVPVNNSWHSICYGNGLFVVVATSGTANRVMTSPDGITWTIRTSAADNTWNSVCYGNGMFVAVASSGAGNRVMTSPDGITWIIRTSAADNAWNSVCYGNGMFVAVATSGTGNRVMTSPDGITWTIQTSSADNSWISVCYGNGMFVAVAISGTTNRVMTSPDGITWTIRTSANNNTWYSVCYGNGIFVAVASAGTGNRVMTSPDGITWTIQTSAADNSWRYVCYGNGLFVAVATSGIGNRVMTSPDGITWTIRTSAADNSWYSICYANGLFVAVATTGTNNSVMIYHNNSKKLIVNKEKDYQIIPGEISNFNTVSPPAYIWKDIAYGNGIYVAIADSGIIMTSLNGINWIVRSSIDASWQKIVYGNGLFVAVKVAKDDYPYAMYSSDGITWTMIQIGTDVETYTYGAFNNACFVNGMFFIGNAYNLVYKTYSSSNGLDWSINSLGSMVHSITFGNNIFVACIWASTSIKKSSDGITWTSQSLGSTSKYWNDIAFGNGLFVMVGQYSETYSLKTIITSPDGITWTERNDPDGVNAKWSKIIYTNGLFIVGGQTGHIMTSPDGITWTIVDNTLTNMYKSILTNNQRILALNGTASYNMKIRLSYYLVNKL